MVEGENLFMTKSKVCKYCMESGVLLARMCEKYVATFVHTHRSNKHFTCACVRMPCSQSGYCARKCATTCGNRSEIQETENDI